MAQPITVTIPHQLGKEEARRRVQDGFGRLRDQLAAGMLRIVKFEEEWQEDRMNFEGGSLGQVIRGHLDVSEDSVVLSIELPEILAALAATIKGRLTSEAQKMLEKN